LLLTQPPSATWPITSSIAAKANSRSLAGTGAASAGKRPDSRRHNRNSRLRVAKPPSRCAVTTCGHSCSVTVHMPNAACAITTPSNSNGSFTGRPGSSRRRRACTASPRITSPRAPAK